MKHLWSLVVFLVVANILVWMAVRPSNDRTLKVSFLDVGQGDAIFIESPSGTQVLIDAGAHRNVLRPLGKVMPFYDRSIDAVFYTHVDADHIGDLPEVLDRHKVSLIGIAGFAGDGNSLIEALEERTKAEEAVVAELARGQIFDLGDGAVLEIIFPEKGFKASNSNLSSAIMKLSYGTTDFLLTGDAPRATEEYLALLDGRKLQSEVLKVSHHGSDTSSSRSFLSAVLPDYAVVSAGCENPYGHPHREVLDRLLDVGADIVLTCEKGTITFISDGESVKLR